MEDFCERVICEMAGIPSIIRKIETMEELTEEERDQFLQFVQEPFLSMLDE